MFLVKLHIISKNPFYFKFPITVPIFAPSLLMITGLHY